MADGILKLDTTEAHNKIKVVQEELIKLKDLYESCGLDSISSLPIQIKLNESEDVMIFTHPHMISDANYQHIKNEVKKVFNGVKVLILDGGLELASVVKSCETDITEEHF